MKRKIGSFAFFLSKAILFLAIPAVFFFGHRYFYVETLFFNMGNYVLLLLYTAILYLAGRVYNGFDFGNASIQEIIVSWILNLIIINTFQYFILSLMAEGLLPLRGFLVILAVQVVFVVPSSLLINALHSYLKPALETLVIYGDNEKLRIYKLLIAKQRNKLKVVDTISQHKRTGSLLDAINKVEAVLFLDMEETQLEGLLEYCYLNEKQTFIVPTFSRVLYHTAGTIWLSNTPVFSMTKVKPDTSLLFIKRLIDIVVSLIAIIISSPLMVIIWLAVRLHDNHPAIYKQERVTKNGKIFKMYKFRSMKPDSEGDEVPRLTVDDDPRITPVGRFIRSTRLDELPQLFNVLFGAMSIVGPRPEWAKTAQMYEEQYPVFALRTKVKAGITGFAQIYGRHNTAPEEKILLDIMYIETFSILGDIKLMLQTVNVLFKPASNEGYHDN